MADIREQDLALKTSISDTDWIRLVTPTGNHRMTVGQFKDLIGYTALQQSTQSHSEETVSDDVHGLAWSEYEELTLLNGWTGYLRVRRNAMDLVYIYGQITPGVTDRGTTIANVPSLYRPGRVSALPAQSAGLNVGAINGLAVTTSGNITIYGAASEDIGTFEVRINHIYKP